MKYTHISILCVCALPLHSQQVRYDDEPCPQSEARTVSEEFSKSTVYQIFLRPFTRAGTLKAGEKLLEHVASLGVGIIQLCPVVLADDDANKDFWSGRQKAFGKNPKNPYRQKDYFKIDPEYGTPQDLKEFVAKAHSLGLKVVYDIVYFHCGPKAYLISEHPDFVKRNPDGTVKVGDWKFPQLDYDNPKLREYMLKNMEYLVKEYDFDGFRCDVEDLIPLSFWEEGAKRMRKLKPDFLFFSEGIRPKNHLQTYDASYGFYWLWALKDVYEKGGSAEKLMSALSREKSEFPKNSVFLRCRENHDMAMDAGDKRPDKSIGRAGADSILFLNFSIDGVPFIYNGNEVADVARHSIFSNRYYGGLGIDWSNALTDDGKRRMQFVKKLVELKKSLPALYRGSTIPLKNSSPEKIVSFARADKNSGQTLICAANTKNSQADVFIDFDASKNFKTKISSGAELYKSGNKLSLRLEPYGFIMAEVSE